MSTEVIEDCSNNFKGVWSRTLVFWGILYVFTELFFTFPFKMSSGFTGFTAFRWEMWLSESIFFFAALGRSHSFPLFSPFARRHNNRTITQMAAFRAPSDARRAPPPHLAPKTRYNNSVTRTESGHPDSVAGKRKKNWRTKVKLGTTLGQLGEPRQTSKVSDVRFRLVKHGKTK